MPVKSYWETKSLDQMTSEEWEMLCDGCGRCCLHKIEDQDSGEMFYTNVACRLLDTASCRCQDYPNRRQRVDTCFVITADNVRSINWLPESCAYRRLSEGRGLAWWHPLVSGNTDTVIEAGISVKDRCVSETFVHPDNLPEFVVTWLDEQS